MHRIGTWAASLYDDPLVFPQEVPTSEDPETLVAVAWYLETGVVHARYRGYTSSRFASGTPDEQMGHRELTDGTWSWPEGLLHYVLLHRVALPEAFTRTALGLEVNLPPADPADPESLWASWCQDQRTDAARILAASLRSQCDAECAAALEAHYSSVAASHGTSGTQCSWAGCCAQALRERALCARHLDEGSDQGAFYVDVPGRRDRYTDRYLATLGAPTA